MTGSLGIALAIALVGCDPVETGQEDPEGSASDGEDDDGPEPEPGAGLTVQFAYLGGDGEPVSGDGEINFDNFKIKSMTMQLHDLKLIGDTVPSGGLTSQSRVLEFPWSSSPSVFFSGTPPGLYSELDFRVERTYHDEALPSGFGDMRLSVKVVGEAFFESGDLDFEYADDQNVDIELHFSEDVPPGAPGTIAVELDLLRWFSVLNWQALADQVGGGEDGGEGEDDGGEDGGNGGPGNGMGGGGGTTILIGLEGDAEAAQLMRDSLAGSFRVQ